MAVNWRNIETTQPMKKTIISTIVRKAVETVCKALDMAIVAVRKAERKDIIGTPNAILQTHANTKYSTGITKKSNKG